MPCDTRPNLDDVQKDRMRKSIASLEKALEMGLAKVNIGPGGAIAFQGWAQRDGWSDLCAYRKLSSSNSPALRKAIARAEAMTGRKVDPRAIASGQHSHDGGRTWSTH